MSRSPAFARIQWDGRWIDIEYEWVGRPYEGQPIMVFLHEGLGSRSMWKDFPDTLCQAMDMAGLVYSRPGYGRSSPRPAEELWDLNFMHRQAEEVLPAFLWALGIDPRQQTVWLFGHSDGGSIALLYAARYVEHLAGVIVLAPHIMVEDLTVDNIEKARQAYLTTDLRQKLGKHHDDPDSPFWGWNTIWLDPRFRHWSIEEEIASIRCPVLAVQGRDDEYGTMAQIYGISHRVPQTELLELEHCGHSPHRDQPGQLIAASTKFVKQFH